MKFTTTTSTYFPGFYHKVSKKKNRIRGVMEVLRLQAIIYETIAEHYLENEGGVYLNGMGYMCHMLKKGVKFPIKLGNKIINESRDGRDYYHTVIEILDYEPDYIHFEVGEGLKRKSTALTRNGRKYRFLYREAREKHRINKKYRYPLKYDVNKLKYVSKNTNGGV